MIFDDICVFELDFTLLFFREILNIFRCFSEYWKILKVSKSRNLCVRRRADLQKVHSQPGLEVGYVSRVSMRKKSFGIDCLQKSYSIIIVITTMIIYCVCFFCAFCDNRHSRRSEGWPHTLVRFTYVYLYIYIYVYHIWFNGPSMFGQRQVAGVLVNLDPKSPNAAWIQMQHAAAKGVFFSFDLLCLWILAPHTYLIAFGKPAGHREVAQREFDVQLLCVKASVCRSFCV